MSVICTACMWNGMFKMNEVLKEFPLWFNLTKLRLHENIVLSLTFWKSLYTLLRHSIIYTLKRKLNHRQINFAKSTRALRVKNSTNRTTNTSKEQISHNWQKTRWKLRKPLCSHVLMLSYSYVFMFLRSCVLTFLYSYFLLFSCSHVLMYSCSYVLIFLCSYVLMLSCFHVLMSLFSEVFLATSQSPNPWLRRKRLHHQT